MSTQSSQEFRFDAEIIDPKKLIPMLKAIQIVKTTVMAITNRGLKLTCEDSSKCLQATSFIDRSLFRDYDMSDDESPGLVCFRLLDLLNVLGILGSTQQSIDRSAQHSLKISYTSLEDKLRLRLKDETFETKATIKTYSYDELMIFRTNFCNKVILNTEPVLDFWKGTDLTSEHIEISITREEPYFQWTTESPRAIVKHNIHRDSSQVEVFDCTADVRNKYKMSSMKCTLKVLAHTSKVSVRTDERGLLSLQFMIDFDDPDDHCFVEYFIVPDIENPND